MGKEESQLDSEQREEQLAVWMEHLFELHKNKEPIDWDAIRHEVPELADELYDLWQTALIAHAWLPVSGEIQTENQGSTADHLTQDYTSFAKRDVEQLIKDAENISSKQREELTRKLRDYEIISELGRGGMGVVFRAHQISLDREVAIKMILRGDLASHSDLARFRSEAESTARLDHPNIVPIYEVGEVDQQPFFTMKYVEGTHLAELLQTKTFTNREIAELFVQIARGIEEAHRQGILHRDLKPSNILINHDGQPMIVDFGLAKRLKTDASLTRTGAIVGTPAYMPPEQAAGSRGELGPASDIYSLGAILYHMLTGQPPHQADTPVDTVLMVLEQDPVPPKILNKKVDPDLEFIALKCLQKPIDLRYSSAAGLAQDLEAYLKDEPISARSGNFRQVIGSFFRDTHHSPLLQRWGFLWILHAIVVFILCGITNYLYLQEEETPRLTYALIWIIGFSVWAAVFWKMRQQAGPVTFVERQIAHVWGGSMAGSFLLFLVEWLMGFKTLELSPVLPLIGGSVFTVKAAMFSGKFYIAAISIYASAIISAIYPDYGIFIFGTVTFFCFILPGFKHHLASKR